MAYLQGENQPSNYSSIASDAGSDNNSDVNEPGNPPESFIITNPASPVQEPVTPAITTNQPVFEMPIEQLRILIREEVRLQQTLHRPSTFETQPTGQSSAPRPVGQLSPASCHSRNPEVQVPSSGHALFQEPTIPTSQPPIRNCENFPATSVAITATTGMSLSSIQLPPLSSNILKSIQNKEYIDFNNLLPASLYDYSANQATLNLQFNPYEMGNNSSIASDAGSDNNSDVNEPGNPPESFIITNPASPVQEPVTPAITTNQPVFEMPIEQLRILIREEVRLQQTLHRPSTFETQPTGQSSAPRPVGQLSPASCHSRNPEVQVPSSGHALFQEPTIPTSQPPIRNCENFPATSVAITATTGMSLSSIQLPPLSSNILKSIQNKEYIDFNNLLPASLYDYSANQATLNLHSIHMKWVITPLLLRPWGKRRSKSTVLHLGCKPGTCLSVPWYFITQNWLQNCSCIKNIFVGSNAITR